MASATGIPADTTGVVNNEPHEGYGEEEPLLGRAGDAAQQDGQPLYYNLFIGTAVIAQAGIILLTASVWASVFLHPLILFSAHPLLNSAALLVLVQGILILQPTHTATQKRQGTLTHFTLVNLAIDALIAGLVIIEYNKIAHNGIHFVSPHAILGLITYIFLLIQALVGFTTYFFPRLYGSVDKAKSLYKWHRLSGYVILVLILATVTAATKTDYNIQTLDIKIWAVLISAVLILIGVFPRIKKQKFGLGPKPSGAFGQTMDDEIMRKLTMYLPSHLIVFKYLGHQVSATLINLTVQTLGLHQNFSVCLTSSPKLYQSAAMPRSQLKKFHLFPKLPTEIRLIVWEMLIRPCIIQGSVYGGPAPSLLHINQETRSMAIKAGYKLLYSHPNDMASEQIDRLNSTPNLNEIQLNEIERSNPN
ncbi:hypothetical protein B7494_g5447 [Chlorociboria aeruginascens]|nr:hypothetical protein B7494_g5447 [Chlorociboria aeruginascens]